MGSVAVSCLAHWAERDVTEASGAKTLVYSITVFIFKVRYESPQDTHQVALAESTGSPHSTTHSPR